MLYFIHYVFFGYTILIAVRMIASWFPAFQGQPWLRLIAKCTDPFLNVFRRIIPPIGGRLDLSPMLAFLGLKLMENCVFTLVNFLSNLSR
ncbi:MAG TPA: YggT family protein [Rhabdochlamydiaceae bacterium]